MHTNEGGIPFRLQSETLAHIKLDMIVRVLFSPEGDALGVVRLHKVGDVALYPPTNLLVV